LAYINYVREQTPLYILQEDAVHRAMSNKSMKMSVFHIFFPIAAMERIRVWTNQEVVCKVKGNINAEILKGYIGLEKMVGIVQNNSKWIIGQQTNIKAILTSRQSWPAILFA